jgi:hypothetical protein
MNNQVLAALIRMARAGDQNAAHAVESEIDLRGLAERYEKDLTEIAVTGQSMLSNISWLVLHATAEQRAQAALKVLASEISDMFGGER